ncbi:CAP domain-containing protein [Limimaricola pyoseonensis]|uniref:Cysteine-rich secretory protein family protein n=1 Tax=Limimaricola pyoseonensis TaxID=521013 RepID=A0A1G7KL03_9RHOB|nr:CAP domain-containing protein [Limimaricola pyoseonensis]SDF37479.1 Cysteine-rich secretory protein family protein [Limimaricola pyoseonensis]
MRHLTLLALPALQLLTACGGGADAYLPDGTPVDFGPWDPDPIPQLRETPDGPMGYGDFALVLNEVRTDNGTRTLEENAKLNRASRDYADLIGQSGPLSHTGPDGSTPGDRAREAGYDYSFIAENLARGYPSDESVVDAWMNSDGHRENMLDERAEDFGLGRVGANWVLMVGAEK